MAARSSDRSPSSPCLPHQRHIGDETSVLSHYTAICCMTDLLEGTLHHLGSGRPEPMTRVQGHPPAPPGPRRRRPGGRPGRRRPVGLCARPDACPFACPFACHVVSDRVRQRDRGSHRRRRRRPAGGGRAPRRHHLPDQGRHPSAQLQRPAQVGRHLLRGTGRGAGRRAQPEVGVLRRRQRRDPGLDHRPGLRQRPAGGGHPARHARQRLGGPQRLGPAQRLGRPPRSRRHADPRRPLQRQRPARHRR